MSKLLLGMMGVKIYPFSTKDMTSSNLFPVFLVLYLLLFGIWMVVAKIKRVFEVKDLIF